MRKDDIEDRGLGVSDAPDVAGASEAPDVTGRTVGTSGRDARSAGASNGVAEPRAEPAAAGPPLVQSLTRAFDLLELMADAGGEAGLSELADTAGLPLPTIHRLMRTLVARGYARQEESRRYALGPKLIRLGDSAGRLLGVWAHPYLTELVELTGETANLALREGDNAVYVAQVPSRHAMRMFTELGRRVPLHTSGVGKAILAQLPPGDVDAILARTELVARTPNTITDPTVLREQLDTVRARGYAQDDGEYEIGVSCVAVPLTGTGALAALSVSGPVSRLTAQTRPAIAPLMQDVAGELTRWLETQHLGAARPR